MDPPSYTVEALIELLPLGAHILEATGATPDTLVVRAVNRAASEHAGADLRPLIGRPSVEMIPAGSDLAVTLHRHALSQEPLVTDIEYDGARFTGWFRMWVRPIGGGRILTLYEDVTEERRSEQRLRDSELLNRSIIEHLSEGVVVIDAEGIVRVVNPAISALCRVDAGPMVGRHIRTLPVKEVLNADGGRLRWRDAPAVRALAGEVVRSRLFEVVRLDDSRAWFEVSSKPLLAHGQARPRGAVSTYVDVTQRVERERRVRHEADHDALTGLANRRVLERALRATLGRAGETGQRVAVLVVDLDGFKAINDRHGHAAGDRALREAADRLCEAVRDRDLVARVGGDEFVVMLPDLGGSADTAEALRDRVGAVLRRPFELRDGVVALSATIGLARFPDQATTPRGLLDVADRDMYARKGAHRRDG